jgi:hypothetical protein
LYPFTQSSFFLCVYVCVCSTLTQSRNLINNGDHEKLSLKNKKMLKEFTTRYFYRYMSSLLTMSVSGWLIVESQCLNADAGNAGLKKKASEISG